ncbi:rhomboid family intramembrane serine protease [Oleiharenicola lentus]|uniref:rhomboid family intramembrane serine protease n=1 Tax=Oleiharenicola lentus TaxID=2508720 RepID=UPI003F66BB94
MPDVPSASPSEITFPIEYQLTGSIEHNRTLKGSGTLAINPAGPTYRFTGNRRATFSSEPVQLILNADEIWNVTLRDRAVYFTTKNPAARAKDDTFVFFCASAAEAHQVASLLPARVDSHFTAERDFAQRLHNLGGAQHPVTSITTLIIVANVAAFVIMGTLGAGWFTPESMEPYVLYGANNGAATTNGEWWRLLTSMFVHYGLIHLMLNMWALFQAGQFMERLQGRTLYALTYLASGLAGGFASIWWNSAKPIWSAGASGAVFGVFGAMLGYMLREKHAVPSTVFKSILKSSLVFAGYNLFYGLAAKGIDNAAHLGGALGGFIFGWLLALPLDPARRPALFVPRFFTGLTALMLVCAAGVFFTPRFAYNPRESYLLGSVDERYAEREKKLSQSETKTIAAIRAGNDPLAQATLIEKDLIPFYADWARELRALPMTSKLDDTEVRDINQRHFEFRIEVLKNLVAALRRNDPDALKTYAIESQQALAEIKRYNATHGSK